MGRPMTSPLQVARHLLASDQAWTVLLECALRVADGEPARVIRLADSAVPITCGGKVFQACSMRIELPEDSIEGSLGQMRISVPNTLRTVTALIDSGDFGIGGGEGPGPLLGRPVTAYLAHTGDLSALPAGLKWRHAIIDATITEEAAQLVAGDPAQIARLPRKTWDRSRAPQLLPGSGVIL